MKKANKKIKPTKVRTVVDVHEKVYKLLCETIPEKPTYGGKRIDVMQYNAEAGYLTACDGEAMWQIKVTPVKGGGIYHYNLPSIKEFVVGVVQERTFKKKHLKFEVHSNGKFFINGYAVPVVKDVKHIVQFEELKKLAGEPGKVGRLRLNFRLIPAWMTGIMHFTEELKPVMIDNISIPLGDSIWKDGMIDCQYLTGMVMPMKFD